MGTRLANLEKTGGNPDKRSHITLPARLLRACARVWIRVWSINGATGVYPCHWLDWPCCPRPPPSPAPAPPPPSRPGLRLYTASAPRRYARAIVQRLHHTGMRCLCLRPHSAYAAAASPCPHPRCAVGAAVCASAGVRVAVADADGDDLDTESGGDADALPNNDAGPARALANDDAGPTIRVRAGRRRRAVAAPARTPIAPHHDPHRSAPPLLHPAAPHPPPFRTIHPPRRHTRRFCQTTRPAPSASPHSRAPSPSRARSTSSASPR
ncbi:hypothetical protein C8J57DRAFT_1564055 [Mycena rebaudengoi]|nr:hypothetical protein C8J57DRAFT_1564055 [Mycena rebaudengoi]